MGNFLEEIMKTATGGGANDALGSILEAAKQKVGGNLPGGLGDILGNVTGGQDAVQAAKEAVGKGNIGDILNKLGVGGATGGLDLGDMAKSVINVIGVATSAVGKK